ncbi:MAG: hypothetical protein AB1726_16490 [Planctomycetota bacterium]
MEVRIAHRIALAEAVRRIRATGRELGLEPGAGEGADDPHGTFTKLTPVGPVSASWTVTPGEVVVRVLAKPAFLPDATVGRLLEDGLRRTLDARP